MELSVIMQLECNYYVKSTQNFKKNLNFFLSVISLFSNNVLNLKRPSLVPWKIQEIAKFDIYELLTSSKNSISLGMEE